MPTRLDHLAAVVAHIRAQGHGCCLVGGLAVTLRVRERATKDIDLAVAVGSDREAEQLAGSLIRAGYPVTHVLEQTERGVIATIRFALPEGTGDPELDLLFHSCGIESEIVAAADPIQVAGMPALPVARIEHLIAMKVLSESAVRANDRSDLHVMVAAATEEELERCRTALHRIARLGYARGKDLQAVLDGYLARRPR